MHANGVSHAVVRDDVSGVDAILRWLAYVPRRVGAPLPCWPTPDPLRRPPAFTPAAGVPYDPRELLAGFFDAGSFTEAMSEWGKSVVAGRACLGGMPMGCIAVETRTTEKTVPADPAFAGAQQTTEQQAGQARVILCLFASRAHTSLNPQVWFPDSAFKTAQAIADFDGEGLPLLVFANWRGFAGGMRDMFGEVLKFGAMIVDGLRAYRQPVVVYIPAHGELRGGAWVVIDATINAEQMELFCADSARGGVLEPEGIVDIKFRREDLVRAMRRTLPPAQPGGDLHAAGGGEAALLPLFKQVAVAFAALHDTPGVMRAKGAVTAVVPWGEAREFFGRHLRRRVAAARIATAARAASPGLDAAAVAAAVAELKPLVDAAGAAEGPVAVDEAPEARAFLKALRSKHIRAEVSRMMAEDPAAVRAALAQ